MSDTLITLPAYNADRIQKALKLRQFDQLEWGADAKGDDALMVRMPGGQVNLILSRNDLGYYGLRVNRTDNAGELEQRVDAWLGEYRVKHAMDGRYSEPQLRRAFEATRQHYRSIHVPQPLVLPAEKNDICEPLADTATSYPYPQVMAALHGRGRLQWQPRRGYGNECIQLDMPDASTSLIIRRNHDKEGAYHQVFAAGGATAEPALVARTEQHIHTCMKARDAECQCGGLRGKSLQQLLNDIRQFECNQSAAPTKPSNPSRGQT